MKIANPKRFAGFCLAVGLVIGLLLPVAAKSLARDLKAAMDAEAITAVEWLESL